MGTAMKHHVPDRVKSRFLVFITPDSAVTSKLVAGHLPRTVVHSGDKSTVSDTQ